MLPKKVLIFSPYGLWQVHTQVDAVFGAALKHRGCEIKIIGCDSIFEKCPISSTKKNCPRCIDLAAKLFSGLNLEIAQLSSFLTAEIITYCKDWSNSIDVKYLSEAIFEGKQISKWISGGVHSCLMSGCIDFSNKHIEDLYRCFLFNGAMISKGYECLLESYYPDHVISYSSIHSYYRVIFEMSCLRKIPVLVHERGPIDDSFICLDNENQSMSAGRVEFWKNWKNIPLSKEECLFVKKLIYDRESGINSNLDIYYKNFSSAETDIRSQLNIPKDVHIVALFTSGDWEIAMEKWDSPMTFSSQIEGISHIIEYFRHRKEYLVIRHHPNISRISKIDTNFIEKALKTNREIPENVRVIMPNEQLKSYSIIWEANAIITFGSTLGLESLARGVSVLSGLRNRFTEIGIGINFLTKDVNIDSIIQKTNNFQIKDLQQIYRSLYYFYNRLIFKFNSFGIKNNYEANIKIKYLEDLNKGKDPALDQVCDYIIYNASLYPKPNKEELERLDIEETKFLQNELLRIKEKRLHANQYALLKKKEVEPLVTVVLLCNNKQIFKSKSIIGKCLKRSRHKSIEEKKVFYSGVLSYQPIRQVILEAIKNSKGEYIFIGTENIHIDESFFSSSVQYFMNAHDYKVLLPGVWLCNDKGCLRGEIFTDRDFDLNYIIKRFSFIDNMVQALSFFLWEKKSLIQALTIIEKIWNQNYKITNFFNSIIKGDFGFKTYQIKTPLITMYHPSYCSQVKPLCLLYTTYDQIFLESFYNSNKHLLSESYENQKATLTDTLFGDSVFYSKNLKEYGWKVEDFISNIAPLQLRWAKEHNFTGNSLEITTNQIKHNQPQIVYFHDMTVGKKELLEVIRPHTELIVGQIASPLQKDTDIHGFDIIFSSFPHFVDYFRSCGIISYYQPLAFDPKILQKIGSLEKIYPVTFEGAISNLDGKVTNLLERLAELTPIKFWGFGANSLSKDSLILKKHRGMIFGLDMFRLLAQSLITVHRHNHVGDNYANNMRLFEATGCGALLITDYKDNLNELFEIGNEVIAYRSSEECAELINYYLKHPDEAHKIAKAGQDRTLKDHSYSLRMKQTSEILLRHLRYIKEKDKYNLPESLSPNYQNIDCSQITQKHITAWKNKGIPPKQRRQVQNDLNEMYAGQPPAVYQVLAEVMDSITKGNYSILEIGCSSGYYYEVLEYLLKKRLKYTGVDYSQALIDMARNYYPEIEFHVADGANLPFENEFFDTVISSCILLYTPNYSDHIKETARVANKYVIAHRTPVCRNKKTQFMKKSVYGVEVVELQFNEQELLSLFQTNNLKLLRLLEYFSNSHVDRYEVTYLFEKI